eukprot:g13409.t1
MDEFDYSPGASVYSRSAPKTGQSMASGRYTPAKTPGSVYAPKTAMYTPSAMRQPVSALWPGLHADEQPVRCRHAHVEVWRHTRPRRRSSTDLTWSLLASFPASALFGAESPSYTPQDGEGPAAPAPSAVFSAVSDVRAEDVAFDEEMDFPADADDCSLTGCGQVEAQRPDPEEEEEDPQYDGSERDDRAGTPSISRAAVQAAAKLETRVAGPTMSMEDARSVEDPVMVESELLVQILSAKADDASPREVSGQWRPRTLCRDRFRGRQPSLCILEPQGAEKGEQIHYFREHLTTLRHRQQENMETLDRLLFATEERIEDSLALKWKEGDLRDRRSCSVTRARKQSSMLTIQQIAVQEKSEAWDVACDQHETRLHRCQALCQMIVAWRGFEFFLAFVIILNSVLVGIDLNMSVWSPTEEWLPAWVEITFVVIYMIEAGLRMTAMGVTSYFCDPWCILDIFLTFSGFISRPLVQSACDVADRRFQVQSLVCLVQNLRVQPVEGILLPFLASTIGLRNPVRELQTFLIVRSLRILRLMRALRALTYFRTVWRLVHGLLTSGNAMMWPGRQFGVPEVITKDTALMADPETAAIVVEHFSGLGSTLLTLTRFITLDSAAGIYIPLIQAKPVLVFYFGAIILFVSIALMTIARFLSNLVTATLVEGALINSQKDRDLDQIVKRDRLRKALPKLLQLFHDVDKDDNQLITLEEMKAVPPKLLPPEIFETGPVASMEDGSTSRKRGSVHEDRQCRPATSKHPCME